MLLELLINALHSSPQAYLGVSLIGIYFMVIVSTAAYRIYKAEHIHH